jgi:hypothetical protein
LFVFRKNGEEAARLTLGFVDDLGAVGFGLFEKLGGFTTRAGEDAVGIGVGLTFQPVAFLFGGLNLAEGVDHLFGGSARSRLRRTIRTPLS